MEEFLNALVEALPAANRLVYPCHAWESEGGSCTRTEHTQDALIRDSGLDFLESCCLTTMLSLYRLLAVKPVHLYPTTILTAKGVELHLGRILNDKTCNIFFARLSSGATVDATHYLTLLRLPSGAFAKIDSYLDERRASVTHLYQSAHDCAEAFLTLFSQPTEEVVNRFYRAKVWNAQERQPYYLYLRGAIWNQSTNMVTERFELLQADETWPQDFIRLFRADEINDNLWRL